MYFLQELLQESENDNPQDAHLAFQGEDGIATDELWDSAQIRQMAVCGWEILMEYSGWVHADGWCVERMGSNYATDSRGTERLQPRKGDRTYETEDSHGRTGSGRNSI